MTMDELGGLFHCTFIGGSTAAFPDLWSGTRRMWIKEHMSFPIFQVSSEAIYEQDPCVLMFNSASPLCTVSNHYENSGRHFLYYLQKVLRLLR